MKISALLIAVLAFSASAIHVDGNDRGNPSTHCIERQLVVPHDEASFSPQLAEFSGKDYKDPTNSKGTSAHNDKSKELDVVTQKYNSKEPREEKFPGDVKDWTGEDWTRFYKSLQELNKDISDSSGSPLRIGTQAASAVLVGIFWSILAWNYS